MFLANKLTDRELDWIIKCRINIEGFLGGWTSNNYRKNTLEYLAEKQSRNEEEN